MAIPLTWKAEIYGAEDVKAKLAEIREQYKKGDIGIQEYTQKQTFLARQLRQTNLSLGQQKSIFLAMHPALNKLTQAMSVFGSISRSALSIMNSLNLATIAQTGFEGRIFDLKMDLIESEKTLREMREAGLGPGMAAYDEEIAKNKELNAELNNTLKLASDQGWQNLTTKIFGIGDAIQTAWMGAITTIAAFKLGAFKGLAGTITAFGESLGSAILSGLSKAFLPATIVQMFSDLFSQTAGEEGFGSGIDIWVSMLTKDLPMALGVAGAFLTQFFLKDLPNWANKGFAELGVIIKNITKGITDGIIFIINAVIKGINFLISQWNKAASKSKGLLPKITPLEELKTSTISGGGSASAGGTAPIPGVLTGMTASGGNTIVVNVGGSIWSTKELEKLFNDALKNSLKRTGLG